MRYCIACARDIGEGHEFCPHCGTPQKRTVSTAALPKDASTAASRKAPLWAKLFIASTLLLGIAVVAVSITAAVVLHDKATTEQDDIIVTPDGSIVTTAKTLLKEFNDNEIRGAELFNGKRVSFSGCIESVDDMLLFSSVHVNDCTILGSKPIRAIFPSKAKKSLGKIKKNEKATITCTIVDGGNIMGVLAKDCEINF